MNADVKLSKLVKLEEQEVLEFDVGVWLREFTAKKQKEAVVAKKEEIFSGDQLLFKGEKAMSNI